MNTPDFRSAILQAAAHIERHPAAYDWMTVNVPWSIGGKGCYVGWIGFFAGITTADRLNGKADVETVAVAMGLHSETLIYTRLHDFQYDYAENSKSGVKALRAYADKYYPLPG